MKKKFIKSTIQLIIGLLLLLIVWYYSSLNPDRQRTFFNQFGVLISQIKLFFYNFLGKGQIAKEKVQFEMSYKSLVDLGKHSGCLTGDILKQAEHFLKTIKEVDIDTFKQKKYEFYQMYGVLQEYIKQKCPDVKFYR